MSAAPTLRAGRCRRPLKGPAYRNELSRGRKPNRPLRMDSCREIDSKLHRPRSPAPPFRESCMTRILVVDDHPTQAEEFGDLLRNAGCEVTLAGNGREAMDLLRLDLS